jgi:hypothetical protein
LESVDTTTDVVPTVKDPDVEFTAFTTPCIVWRAGAEEVVAVVVVVVSADTGIATPTTSVAITANRILILTKLLFSIFSPYFLYLNNIALVKKS